MKRFVCAFVLLVSCTAAFADEKTRLEHSAIREGQPPAGEALRTGERALERGQKERTVAPLLYALPELGDTAETMLELRISNARRTLVRETVMVPAGVPESATIDVLITHGKELERLRALDKTNPLRFVASIGDRIVTDALFADVDKAGADLSVESAVGIIREIEVKMVDPLRVRSLGDPDPWCAEQCDMIYQECMDRCDQRGDSCARCSDDYNMCYHDCPDVCTEPKSVSNYTVWHPTNWAWYGNQGCFGWSWSANIYHELYVWYTVTTYQRTEHCDGSYTDTQVGQYNTSGWCWAEQWSSCNNPSGHQYNICP